MNVTDRYVELLANEGYRPKVDEAGGTEIEFKAERLRYRMMLEAVDPEFVAITLDYGIDGEHALEKLLAVANEFNRRVKVVKTMVHPDGDAVRFSYEALSPAPLSPEQLERALFFLRSTSGEYFEEIRREEPKAKA
jgi:hypothetical protein